MKNPISDFTDEFVELGSDVKKSFVNDLVKGIPQTAKQQISGQGDQPFDSSQGKGDKGDLGKKSTEKQDKVDPLTGKPVVKKAQLQHLNQAAGQLRLAKLKKIREELEKQRLKVTDKKAELSPIETSKTQGSGPAITSSSEREPKPDAVANTLKGSKDTGEFKGLIGG